MSFRISAFIYTLLILTSCKSPNQNTENITKKSKNETINVFVGTYTRAEGHVDGKAQGIYRIKLNPHTGKMSQTETIAEIINPSFITLTSDEQILFAVSELARADEESGFITSFVRSETGQYQSVSKIPTDARAPCHVTLDNEEKMLFVTNYLDGTINVLSIGSGGTIEETDRKIVEGSSIHPRQEAPHLHMTKVSPDNSKVFVSDLGSDKIWIFDIDHDNGKLVTSNPSFLSTTPGAGPRHMDISADGNYLYVINELNASVEVFAKQSDHAFNKIQVISTLPPKYEGIKAAADIHLHPSGKFLYGSNRGHDSIVAFRVKENGTLELISHTSTLGQSPRNFNITSDGHYLLVANQDSDNIVVYSIDQESGILLDAKDNYEIMTPVCIKLNF